MDYKEKYENALERARVLMTKGYDVLMPEIFPELKESEDEKIRKVLVDFFKDYVKNTSMYLENIDVHAILAWLEKQQSEKTNPYSGISFEYNGHTWGMCARDNGVDILLDKQLFKHFEKQSKQKPAEWSEEDVEMIDLLINILEINHPDAYFKINDKDDINMRAVPTKKITNWLKSLKEIMKGE